MAFLSITAKLRTARPELGCEYRFQKAGSRVHGSVCFALSILHVSKARLFISERQPWLDLYTSESHVNESS
jgi:hypothetical protein